MIVTPFSLPLPDGERIRGEVRLPDGPPPRSAVVVAHGFKGFKDWAFFPFLGESLAGAGFAAITFNFSLNGVGDRAEHFDRLDAFSRNTLTRELDELHRVVNAVRLGELTPRVPASVGVLGHSRGGGGAVLAAGEDLAITSLVTWAAVANFDRWTPETIAEWRESGRIFVPNTRTGQQMPLALSLLEDFEAHRERLNVVAAAGRVRAPWLVVHGTDDATVLVGDAHRLAEANRAARVHLVEGAGHTFQAVHPFDRVPPELDEAISVSVEHFRRTL